MRAGLLRTQVQIEEAIESRDAHGQPIPAWQLLANRWCSIQGLEGTEMLSARQINAKVTHRITMRSTNLPRRLTPKDRINSGTRIYEILSVIDRAKEHELEIMAFERV